MRDTGRGMYLYHTLYTENLKNFINLVKSPSKYKLEMTAFCHVFYLIRLQILPQRDDSVGVSVGLSVLVDADGASETEVREF